MKRIAYLLLLSLLVVGCSSEPKVKYVFYFIGDGMGVNEVIGTNLYNQANGQENVNFTSFPVVNFITTVSANSLVTDSSAAGTALASGVKINNSVVGVDPEGNPTPNLTEWAHAAGFGTGVATSVGVNHATPASFVAHSSSRNGYEEISLQMIDSPVDFMAGSTFLTNRGSGHDAAYFEHKADSAGIAIFKGPGAIANIDLKAPRVLCLSAKVEDSLPYAIDRKEDDTRLADFTDAGIRYLEARYGKKGFFFMIEGGKIDYAGHGNDAATCFQEVNDMAQSVDLALTFLARYPKETLIVITADHETGGLMLGSGRYEMHPERLAKQHACVDELTNLFRAQFFPTDQPFKTPSWEAVIAFFNEQLGLWGEVEVNERTEGELKEIYDRTFGKGGDRNLTEENLYSSNFRIVADVVRALDRAAGYQWSFGSHSGSPVGLYVTGACAEQFNTVKDNAEIAPLIAKLAGYTK
ncbi:MAG: alkaline phosphatase [Bacteroidales bacterium]|nr:alkaline phosphatase [Bacteroidales bacterium]